MAKTVAFWACNCCTSSSFCFGYKKETSVLLGPSAVISSLVGGRTLKDHIAKCEMVQWSSGRTV